MFQTIKGAPVAGAMADKMKLDVAKLSTYGVKPTLAILRVGERQGDLAYERGAMKLCASVGVGVRSLVLPEDVASNVFFDTLEGLNTEKNIHGILLFRPLPKQLDGERARQMIHPEKDVDGCTDSSLAGVFTNSQIGFEPCTAQAVMEMLHYYGIPCAGKRAVVIGRSLVVGRPLAMMLMQENATVTICHTWTPDVPSITRQADILVTCSGQMESIGKEYLREGQIVLDVGISYNPKKGGLCGDVKFEEAKEIVSALSPVPGGVGTVTTSVLISHVVEAAKRSIP
ncbi:MAG: bifunctional 5,10-methylenetetrahydrofolate dehydrogenase/5,10-methenyltetrahydrofolate cyclohydrolase [Lachnospiraceae bacterium]|nr:bifunctional 5,10-methylenetetrahydrofolate dehydrogenase/5,10-methenyltetrahydrofolate cyclohydrolase [Lachnospiraceae bacterium]